jgi:hypothetical protein
MWVFSVVLGRGLPGGGVPVAAKGSLLQRHTATPPSLAGGVVGWLHDGCRVPIMQGWRWGGINSREAVPMVSGRCGDGLAAEGVPYDSGGCASDSEHAPAAMRGLARFRADRLSVFP